MISDEALSRALSPARVALLGDLVRWSLWAATLVGCVTVAALYWRLGTQMIRQPGQSDFTILYYTSRLVAEHRPMYGDLPAEYGLSLKVPNLGNLNPPHFQLVMALFGRVSYRSALLGWVALNTVVALLSLGIATREVGLQLSLKRVVVGTLAVFGSDAYITVAVTGQMSLLLVLPFTLAWLYARRGRWGIAGLWLGLVASLKLFALFPIAWLAVTRRWAALAGALLSFSGIFILGIGVYGVDSYHGWAATLSRATWYWMAMNGSALGFLERLMRSSSETSAVVEAPGLIWPTWVAVSIGVAVMTTWRTWHRTRPQLAVETDRQFTLLLIASLLISPLGWIYYLPLATAPLLSLVVAGVMNRSGMPVQVLWLGGLALLYVPIRLSPPAIHPSTWHTLTVASTYSWALLALWSALMLMTHAAPNARKRRGLSIGARTSVGMASA